MTDTQHIPVPLVEALEALAVKPNHWYIDATFGRGGHTKAILHRGGRVVAFDWDPEAIAHGQETFTEELAAKKLHLIAESFAQIAQKTPVSPISGILFDFGTSTEQLTSETRGFSFEGDGPLDMRMNPKLGVTAADLLAVVPEKQLADLFRDFGGEKQANSIAKAIKRSPEPIRTTKQLRELVESVSRKRSSRLHPATKVFQALRIAVNSELDQIEQALPQAFELLEPGGKMVTIAFHEGEDRLAKHFMQQLAKENKAVVKNLITASAEELHRNPRARSAKLRELQKL